MAEHLTARQRRPSKARRRKRSIGALSRRLTFSDLDGRTNAGKYVSAPIRRSGQIIIALALTGLMATPARAVISDYFVSGYKLLQRCQNGDRLEGLQLTKEMAQAITDRASCYAYIEGVFDGTADDLPCSLTITLGQVKTIVLNYLEAHPLELHLPAARLALSALNNALELDPDRFCKRLQQ